MGYISCNFVHIKTNISFNVHHLFETDDAPDSPKHWFQFDMTWNLNFDFLFGKHLHWVAVRYVRCVSIKNTNIERTQSIPGSFLIEERYINEEVFKVEMCVVWYAVERSFETLSRSLWRSCLHSWDHDKSRRFVKKQEKWILVSWSVKERFLLNNNLKW